MFASISQPIFDQGYHPFHFLCAERRGKGGAEAPPSIIAFKKKRFWQLLFSLNYRDAISEVPEIFHQNLLQDVRISNNKTWLSKHTKRKHFAMIFNVVTQQKVYSIKKHIAKYGPTLGAWSVDFLAKGTITCFCRQMNNSTTTTAVLKAVGKSFTKLEWESTSRPSIVLYQDKEKSVIQ